MYRLATAALCVAFVASACTTSSDSGVATLTDVAGTDEATESVETEMDTEEAVLAFAACMRENGIEDFPDPEIGSDGSIAFGLGQAGGLADIDREALRSAREACTELLEQAGIGPGSADRTEIEDQLVAFATCMRDNGVDVPDPDFSTEPGQGGGAFGGAIDPSDPEVAAALEACQELFGGRIGPGAARPGGGAGAGGGAGRGGNG